MLSDVYTGNFQQYTYNQYTREYTTCQEAYLNLIRAKILLTYLIGFSCFFVVFDL